MIKEKAFSTAMRLAAVNMLYVFRVMRETFPTDDLGEFLTHVEWGAISPDSEGGSIFANDSMLDGILEFAGVDLVKDEDGDLIEADCYKMDAIDTAVYNKVVSTVTYYDGNTIYCRADIEASIQAGIQYVEDRLSFYRDGSI